MAEVRRVYYPHRLPAVVKDWVQRNYPSALTEHVKAMIVIDDNYTAAEPRAVCTCGERIKGGIPALHIGTAMNHHIAEVLAEMIVAEEREKERRRDEFRRNWRRKQMNQRQRYSPDSGKVRPHAPF